MNPLSPRRKWQTIVVATLVLVPAYWAVLAGMVRGAVDSSSSDSGAALIGFGLAVIPFVFIVLAFGSSQPQAPRAVVRAMGLALLVGVPASAIAADAVTGMVAAVGAGGIISLRGDPSHGWKPRACAVAFASVYAFVLVRTAGPLALLSAPVFPLTALGLADHYVEWKQRIVPA